MSSCLFCDILNGRERASFVYRGDVVSVFMDIRPINPGHLLVVPNRHASYLADLDPKTGARMFQTAQRMSQALRRTDLRCEGVNFFLADGAAAHQEIFHVHLHVFPRYRGDGFAVKVGEHYYQKTPRSELEKNAEKLRRVLQPD